LSLVIIEPADVKIIFTGFDVLKQDRAIQVGQAGDFELAAGLAVRDDIGAVLRMLVEAVYGHFQRTITGRGCGFSAAGEQDADCQYG